MTHEFEVHPELIIVNVPKSATLSEYLDQLSKCPFRHLVLNLAQVGDFNLRDLRALNRLDERCQVELYSPRRSLRAVLKRFKLDLRFRFYDSLEPGFRADRSGAAPPLETVL